MKKLSAYQLACGYVQEKRIGADKIEIYREHGAYHVRRFSKFNNGFNTVQEAWLVFDKLIDARRAFSRQAEIAKNINESEAI
jgi:hypothetical protein